jgi:integrase
MDQGSLNRLFQRINPAFVVQDDAENPRKVSPHSCRATASTILNGMGFNRDWIERQLAHKDRDAIRATYNSAEYLPQRRQMMEAWAQRVMQRPEPNSNVVPIRSEAAA